jgi:hypothetical protein
MTAQLQSLGANLIEQPGWVEPTGRANARPMINSAIPINCYSWVDGFRKGLNPSELTAAQPLCAISATLPALRLGILGS